ncbi:phage late control D family protein [Leptolyngbya sp. AN02str]|uniref:phage late control D family protein n=1 Tax=Leptolyngbya sp. AN02str TaxID=3423363 RepID=UPI003D31674E
MTKSLLIPQPEIWVGGQSLAKIGAALQQARVVTEVDIPGMFSLELTSRNLMPGDVLWVDEKTFNIGTPVEIKTAQEELLIEGEITALELECAKETVSTLIVRGYDYRHRLGRNRATLTFTQMKDSDIVTQIAKKANLKSEVTDTGITHDYVLQHNQSDLDFLQARAKRIGYEISIRGKMLTFHPQAKRDALKDPAILKLRVPEEVTRFSPRLSCANQVAQTEVRGWNMRDKTPVVGRSGNQPWATGMGRESGAYEASQAFGQVKHRQVNQPVATAAEADQIAQGQFRQMALGYITGDGQCVGQARLQAGCMVEIQKVGDRFGGQYYITAATHIFGPERGYTTEFSFKRDAHNWQEKPQ